MVLIEAQGGLKVLGEQAVEEHRKEHGLDRLLCRRLHLHRVAIGSCLAALLGARIAANAVRPPGLLGSRASRVA